MTETFTFQRGEKLYVAFFRFETLGLKKLVGHISDTLGVSVGNYEDLVFAEQYKFAYRGYEFLIVAGDSDTCHVVASGEEARTALLVGLYGDPLDPNAHAR